MMASATGPTSADREGLRRLLRESRQLREEREMQLPRSGGSPIIARMRHPNAGRGVLSVPKIRRRTTGWVRTGPRPAPKTRPVRVETACRAFPRLGWMVAGLLAAAPAAAIVGGQPTDPNQWRWAVSVNIPDVGENALCGGALIARDWVMTAAHCVHDSDNSRFVDASRVQVRVGAHRRTSGGEVIGVSRIHAHPSYDSVADVYDVALLKLAESAPEDLGMVAFPDLATHDRIAPIGTRATALGWGISGVITAQCRADPSMTGCPTLSDVLREVDLPLRSASPSICGAVDSRAEFCAGAEAGKDTCSSDSGGPLLVQDGGIWYQIGITSSGNPECDGSRGGTYARVASFHEWIGETLGASSTARAGPARSSAIVTYAVANAVGRGAARAAVDAIGGRYRARASAPASSFVLAGRDLRSLRGMSDTGPSRADPGPAGGVVEAAAGLLGIEIDPRPSTAVSPPHGFRMGRTRTDAEPRGVLDWRRVTPRDLLTGSSFHVRLSDGAPGPRADGLSLWGEGAFNGFESRNAGISLDGGVASLHLGADYRLDRWLFGLAVGQSRGEVDFKDSKVADPAWGEGTVGIDLTNVLPYLQWSPDGRGDRVVWGTVGIGRGEARLKRRAHDNGTGDLETFMIAGGARMPLARRTAGWDVAVAADGFRVSSETGALKTADGTVQASAGDEARSLRLRGGMEFTKTRALPNGAMDVNLSLAGRLDDGYLTGGDGLGGSDVLEKPSFGAEVGGGIEYAALGGLTATARGRYLAARPATVAEEWGVSARVAYAPAPDGRGPGFSVAPTWGAVEREADAAWNDERWWESVASARAGSGRSRGWMPTGVQARVDYGVGLRGSRMFLTPWTEAGFEDGDLERLRVGATMRMSRRSEEGPELEAFIESGDGGRPTGVMLRGRVSF